MLCTVGCTGRISREYSGVGLPSIQYNTIQYNIRLLEAVRTQRSTIIEREKYVENEKENVKMVHNV